LPKLTSGYPKGFAVVAIQNRPYGSIDDNNSSFWVPKAFPITESAAETTISKKKLGTVGKICSFSSFVV